MAAQLSKPPCSICQDKGYLVRPVGEYAVAERCACQLECPRCGGSGRVLQVVEGLRVMGRCGCQRLVDRVAMWNNAAVPARHAGSTLESYSAGALKHKDHEKFQALTELSRWKEAFKAEGNGRGLVLYGAVGRGKTHLLVSLLRILIFDQGVTARFMEFSRLLGILKEAYDKGQSDRSVMNELVSVPLLAIDELGKGRLSDWELTVVDELVSRRYNAMAPTLGTTNYPPAVATGEGPPNLAQGARMTQSLGDRVGDRVFSRLSEMCDFVEVGGLDFRTMRY